MNDLESLGGPMRDIRKEYHQLIEPYRPTLWKYCYKITGSPWDAEDLVQETLLRAFAALPKLWQPLQPRAFLFRVATNAWLNQCRKRKAEIDWNDNADSAVAYDADPFIWREAIADMTRILPPRQAAVLLLIDVFDFRNDEVAEMVELTEGAVKAILHRARNKMKAHRDISNPAKGETSTAYDSPLIESFIDAFNRRDPDGIAALLSNHATNDIVHVGEEYGKETIRKHSLTGWANDPLPMRGYYRMLWEKPVVIVLTEDAQERKLYTIIELNVEDNEIVAKKNYYFCQDLLLAAGEELRVSVHLNGYTHD